MVVQEQPPVYRSAHEVANYLHDPHRDARKPIYHVLPARGGWASDPSSPIAFRGRFHMFFQHQRSCQWNWGLCWDHVVSEDLVHWKSLPPAVVPSAPDGYDADGCFSGTVEFDPELGVPVILYTGVHLKTNAPAVARHGLPPPEHDPGTRFVERQLAAVPADPDDPDLTHWVKLERPVMDLPPPGLNISCWRDPFCVQRPAAAGGSGDEWVVLLASGIRGVGGAVLRFRSKRLTHGWEFDGLLADGDNAALGIKGQDWECPILAQLPAATRDGPLAAPVPVVGGSCGNGGAAHGAAPGDDGEEAEPVVVVVEEGEGDGSAAALPLPLPAGKPRGGLPALAAKAASGGGGAAASLPGASASPCSSSLLAAHYPAQRPAVAGSTTSDSSELLAVAYEEARSAAGAGGGGAAAAAAASSFAAPPSSPCDTSSTASSAPDRGGGGAQGGHAARPPQQPAALAPAGAESAGASPSPLTEPVLAAAASASAPCEQRAGLIAWLAQSEGHAPQPAAAALPAGTPAAAADCTVILADDDPPPPAAKAAAPAAPAAREPAGQPSATAPAAAGQWWFCMSPDACDNPITWWLGHYDGRRFDVAAADGPHRLDLGATLYAATLWADPKGRQVLYGWIQEHRRVPRPPAVCSNYAYAGCVSTPRLLHLVDGRLHQQPLPEIDALRTQVSWHAKALRLDPGGPMQPLRVVSGTHLNVDVVLLPPVGSLCGRGRGAGEPQRRCPDAEGGGGDEEEAPRAGLLFKSWRPCGRGAAVLSFDWSSHELAFDFDEPFPSAYDPHPADTPAARRVGGRLQHYAAGDPLGLRVLLDGSAVEVFTSTGESLTSRIYRGHPPRCPCTSCGAAGGAEGEEREAALSERQAAAEEEQAGAEDETGIALFAAGAAVEVASVDVWEMGACWAAPPSPDALLPRPHHPGERTVLPAAPAPAAGLLGDGAAAAVPGAAQGVSAAAPQEAVAAAAAAAAAQRGEGEGEAQAAAHFGRRPHEHHVSAGDRAHVAGSFLDGLHIHSRPAHE